MYNTPLPTRAELPTSGQLLRSTLIALVSAAIILVAIVLPSEYGIDPTGVGQKLGLTEMGQIKVQLAAEADADEKAQAQAVVAAPTAPTAPTVPTASPTATATPTPITVQTEPAPAPAAAPAVVAEKPAKPVGNSDEISFTLKPGQGAEIKLVMKAGGKATYSWTANGAIVNFDTHGDGGGRSVTYEQGRGVPSDEGVLEAAFEGNHGWFWRNRTKSDVTVTLKTSGDYIELKRVI